MAIFLKLFERQLKFFKVPDSQWVAYLIGALPSDIATFIARESDDEAQDYVHVKEMLLRRFKLSAEKFRQLFRQHKKVQEDTWRDYYFEIKSYFEGWLDKLKIANFNQLKDLIISDQIKRCVPPEVRGHFVDDWSDWVSPSELTDRLDVYCNIRNITTSVKKTAHLREYSEKKLT
ncbi:uncharacterized protein TNCV_2129741 [Trichonephila clavipes]|nr:uncharacterized protein TNCV_2129741 [Trichonephila clavipes]